MNAGAPSTWRVVLVVEFAIACREAHAARERWRALQAAERLVARPIVIAHGGRVEAGCADRLTAVFRDGGEAVGSAVEILDAMLAPVDPSLRRCPLRVRAGVHAAMTETDDAACRHIAAALAALAQGGGVIASRLALESAHRTDPLSFRDAGVLAGRAEGDAIAIAALDATGL